MIVSGVLPTLRMTVPNLETIVKSAIEAYAERSNTPLNAEGLQLAISLVSTRIGLTECALDIDAEFNLRVWSYINGSGLPAYQYAKDLEHAKELILLSVQAQSDVPEDEIFSNAFGLQIKDRDGDWVEWADEEGNDIMAQVDKYLFEEEEGSDEENG